MCTAKRVLVAEDDPADVFLLKRAFSAAGIPAKLEFVRDGQEAIDYLQGQGLYTDRAEHPLPDFLILDLKMPRMNGFDVLDWIRKKPGLRRLLITILTSSDQPQDINRAYDLGANSYLVKPQNNRDLSDMASRFHKYWLEANQCPASLTE